MTVQDLVDRGYNEEDLTTFLNPSYDGCIIGVSTDDVLIYSLSQMVEWYMKENNCSFDVALEFIDYNTIRSLPYGGENTPIILNDL